MSVSQSAANGRFRQIACRDLLCRLETRGPIALPTRLSGVRGAGYRNLTRTPTWLDCAPLQSGLGELRDELCLQLVGDSKQLGLSKGLVGTYHYLGYQPAAGTQFKYIAYFQNRPMACLSFWRSGLEDRPVRSIHWLIGSNPTTPSSDRGQ